MESTNKVSLIPRLLCIRPKQNKNFKASSITPFSSPSTILSQPFPLLELLRCHAFGILRSHLHGLFGHRLPRRTAGGRGAGTGTEGADHGSDGGGGFQDIEHLTFLAQKVLQEPWGTPRGLFGSSFFPGGSFGFGSSFSCRVVLVV